MRSTVNQPKLISLLCLSILLASCANHLPPRNEHEDRIERLLLSHSLHIDTGTAALELPRRRIRVVEQQTFEETQFAVTRTYERYTPYQAGAKSTKYLWERLLWLLALALILSISQP